MNNHKSQTKKGTDKLTTNIR